MMLYISVRDHARKLNSAVIIIFEHVCYISALAQIRMFKLSIYVLLEFQFLGSGALYLRFETCREIYNLAFFCFY